MRRRAISAVAVTAALCAVSPLPDAIPAAMTIPAAVVTPLSSVTVEPGPFVVTGVLGTARSTIAIRVVDPLGVGTCADEAGIAPNQVSVRFRKTSGGSTQDAWVYLPRVSGIATDGVFRTQWRLGSTRSGTWTMVQVLYCYANSPDASSTGFSADPRIAGFTRTVTVVGTSAPTVTITREPGVVDYGAPQLVKFTYRNAAGRPLSDWPISVGADTQCGLNGNGSEIRRTDRGGTLRLWAPTDLIRCVYLANPAQADLRTFQSSTLLIASRVQRYERYRTVTATASAGRLRVTRPVTVSGVVKPTLGTAWLQRSESGRWIKLAQVSMSGAGAYMFTLRLQANDPGAYGLHHYRVVAVATGQGFAPTASRSFAVQGM